MLFTLVILTLSIAAQEKDSVKTYDLSEITVESSIAIEPKPITKLDQKFLTSFDGRSVYETGFFIPSIKPQTNSRGESLFYIRGSNERQLGLFFDGAFINIPWDNRIDLSLLPTTSLSELKIIKGIPSIIYGANHIAGVIIGTSQNNQTSRLSGNISTLFSDLNQRKLSISLGKRIDNFSVYVSASHYNRDAYALPKDFDNLENPSKLRTNSYQQTNSIFIKAGYNYQKLSNINASIQYLNSEKGVPPEINVANPRYWQYPVWEKTSLNIFGKHSFTSLKNSSIDYVFNIYNFNMQINDFNDPSYSQIANIEKNDDVVLYGRMIYTTLLGSNSIVRFSLSGYSTNHKESFLTNDFQDVLYIQNVYSTGIEHEFLWNRFTAILGLSLDGTYSPETSIHESNRSLISVGFNLTTKYSIDDNLSAQLNFGRKSRFPSLREAFSDGLGRFIINPDLKAETANEGEVGFQFLFPNGTLYTNLFLNYLQDGIVRDVIKLNNEKKFKRINKASILSYGFEAQANYELSKKINTGFQFSYLRSSAKNTTTGEYSDTLEYRPELISSLFLNYSIFKNFMSLAEVSTIHNEYGYQEGYEFFRKLPSYFLINLRLTYNIVLNKGQNLQLFGRVNNIFDKLYYTQWGLPEAGRQFYLGVNYKF